MSAMIKTIGNKKLLADYNTEGKKLALKEDALTAGSNITIDNKVISSDQLFFAEYGTTTYAEIKAAHEAGKICICKKTNNLFATLYAITPVQYRFQYLNAVSSNAQSWNVDTNNVWQTISIIMQQKLTFDTAPKSGSSNPVTSSGIFSYNPILGYSSGGSMSTAADSVILFYIPWISTTDSGIYDRSYTLSVTKYAGGDHSQYMLSPNCHTADGTSFSLNMVSLKNTASVVDFAIIKNPTSTASDIPYWFVCYGYGCSIKLSYNDFHDDFRAKTTATPILINDVEIVSRQESVQTDFLVVPKTPTTGTSVLKCVNGSLQWVNE